MSGLDGLIPPEGELVQDPRFPAAKTWRGPDGVRAWFRQIGSEFDSVALELGALAEAGDFVLATVAISAHGRASGARVRQSMAHLWTFRGEVPLRCRFYLEVAEGRREFERLTAGRHES